MDPVVAGLVPGRYVGAHVLVVPRSRASARAPVDALARAWFAGSAWARVPGGGGPARPMVGARFRGVVPDAVVEPGELRLADGLRAVGPFPLTTAQTRALDLAGGAAEAFALHVDEPGARVVPRGGEDDRDGLSRAFPHGVPTGAERHLLGWAVAVARHVTGAVVVDGGRAVLAPEPASGVDLTLFTAHVLTPDDALGVVRTVVPSAHVVDVRDREHGPAAFRLSGDTPYDGAVQLDLSHVTHVPLALGDLDWREYGPYACGLSWRPPDPEQLRLERPSGLHVIARSRARVLVARLAAMLQGRLGGSLVDDGGFLVPGLDLDERLAPVATPQLWV